MKRFLLSLKTSRKTSRIKYFLFGGASLTAAGAAYTSGKDNLAFFRHARTVFVISRIILDYHFTLKRLAAGEEGDAGGKAMLHSRSANALLNLFKENGGVYIKVGQHLSSLVYLIPPEYTSTLQELQDHCPPCLLNDVESVFQQETGVDMKEMFEWIDPIPVGSASLAAVYKAKIKQGKVVAVKVQHHYLDKQADIDIKTCAVIGSIVKKVFPAFEFDWLVHEMAKNLPKELDFVNESLNAERCRNDFAQFKIVIPKVILATRRVLVMDFVDGGKVSDLEYIKTNLIKPSEVSNRITQVFLDMIFKTQFLHCDPHAGNLMVMPRETFLEHSMMPSILKNIYYKVFGRPFELVLLDHGLYRELDKDFIRAYSNFWIALLNRNEKHVEKYCFQMFQHDKRSDGSMVDYHRLFASMISGRSWDALFTQQNFHSPSKSFITSTLGLSGIANPRTTSEKITIQKKAGSLPFFSAIMLILQKCPRELLLVMKTNDLVRSIDMELGGALDQWSLMRNASSVGWSCLKLVCGDSFGSLNDVGVEERRDYSNLYLKLLVLDTLLFFQKLAFY